MSFTPSNNTITFPSKTEEVDPHALAVMSDAESMFTSGIKSEQDEEVSRAIP